MDAVDFVEPLIIGLLSDEDHFVRAEAARTLVHCKSPLGPAGTAAALVDRSVSVREAAELALRKWAWIMHGTRFPPRCPPRYGTRKRIR